MRPYRGYGEKNVLGDGSRDMITRVDDMILPIWLFYAKKGKAGGFLIDTMTVLVLECEAE